MLRCCQHHQSPHATRCLNKTFGDKKIWFNRSKRFVALTIFQVKPGIFLWDLKNLATVIDGCRILTFVSPAEQGPSSRTSPFFLHYITSIGWMKTFLFSFPKFLWTFSLILPRSNQGETRSNLGRMCYNGTRFCFFHNLQSMLISEQFATRWKMWWNSLPTQTVVLCFGEADEERQGCWVYDGSFFPIVWITIFCKCDKAPKKYFRMMSALTQM